MRRIRLEKEMESVIDWSKVDKEDYLSFLSKVDIKINALYN